MSPGAVGRRRGRRRVVALSPQDRERVARGGHPGDPTVRGVDALSPSGSDALPERTEADLDAAWGDWGTSGEGANDARLLGEVPPHWQ